MTTGIGGGSCSGWLDAGYMTVGEDSFISLKEEPYSAQSVTFMVVI